MASNKGTVKFYDGKKGFGFIVPEDGGPDVFVHVSQIERGGLIELKEKQKVGFDIEERRGKKQAINIVNFDF